MNKKEMILTALAASSGAVHTPVQIQKLLFLLDRRTAAYLGGPFFQFVPYDYGPFDKEIYGLLDGLSGEGLVEIISQLGIPWKKYRLTPIGQQAGNDALSRLDDQVSDYIRKLSDFVRSLSFTDLLSTIYREYPEMKANSVFREQS